MGGTDNIDCARDEEAPSPSVSTRATLLKNPSHAVPPHHISNRVQPNANIGTRNGPKSKGRRQIGSGNDWQRNKATCERMHARTHVPSGASGMTRSWRWYGVMHGGLLGGHRGRALYSASQSVTVTLLTVVNVARFVTVSLSLTPRP